VGSALKRKWREPSLQEIKKLCCWPIATELAGIAKIYFEAEPT